MIKVIIQQRVCEKSIKQNVDPEEGTLEMFSEGLNT